MTRNPLVVLIFFCVAWLAAFPGHAQEAGQEGGPGPGAQGFGPGNGIRGTVIAAPDKPGSTGKFTVRTDEGDTYEVLYSPNTRIMKERQPVQASEIHMGDMLIAAGEVDKKAKTVGAVFLFDIDAERVRAARADFGKTWTAGKVTAIQDLKITIERAGDKQSQVITVDENTSFRKHGEDITLADVKVGDFISAQGGLHDAVFLATTLRVMGQRTGTPAIGPP